MKIKIWTFPVFIVSAQKQCEYVAPGLKRKKEQAGNQRIWQKLGNQVISLHYQHYNNLPASQVIEFEVPHSKQRNRHGRGGG